MHRDIDEIDFTIFDTETTGLDPNFGDRIVEIAGIRFKGREILASFQSLVNPKRQISEGAFRVNGITADMVKDAPLIEKVLPDFLDFVKDSCLCSYNASFDMGFINSELRSFDRDFPTEIIVLDILKMSRKLMPELQRHSLWFVSEALGIRRQQNHRALQDVELTLDVFRILSEMAKKKGIAEFGSFISLFGINIRLLDDMNARKLSEIQEAINLGLRLKIKYFSSGSAQVTEREVVPRQIIQERNSNYLLGFCSLRNDERSFRLDNIIKLEVF